MEVRTLVERATRWLINNRRRPIDIGAAVEQLADRRAAGPSAPCRRLLTGRDARGASQTAEELLAGRACPTTWRRDRGAARRVRRADHRPDRRPRRSGPAQGRRGALRPRPAARPGPVAGADRRAAAGRPLADDGSGRAARRPARGARPADRRGAAGAADGTPTPSRGRWSARWEKATRGVPESVKILRSITASRPDLARMSVGLRVVRGLLPSLALTRGCEPVRRAPSAERVRPCAIDLHTHSSVSDGTDSPAELVRKARAGRAGRRRADRPRHVRRARRGGRRRRAARHPGRPRHGALVRRARAAACTCWLRRRSGEPGLAAEMERVRGGRMGRLAPVLERAGRARRAGHRGAGAGPGRRQPVGRPAAHRRRAGRGRPRARPHGGVRPVPGRRRPGPRAAVRDRDRPRHRPGPRGRRRRGDRPPVGPWPGARTCPRRC